MSNVSNNKLRELRTKAGETITEVADAFGVTPASISAYELGTRTPSDPIKFKLAEHYHRTVGFIFFTDRTH